MNTDDVDRAVIERQASPHGPRGSGRRFRRPARPPPPFAAPRSPRRSRGRRTRLSARTSAPPPQPMSTTSLPDGGTSRSSIARSLITSGLKAAIVVGSAVRVGPCRLDRMVSKYRSVLSVPGATRLFASALVARLPQGMSIAGDPAARARHDALVCRRRRRRRRVCARDRGLRTALGRLVDHFGRARVLLPFACAPGVRVRAARRSRQRRAPASPC